MTGRVKSTRIPHLGVRFQAFCDTPRCPGPRANSSTGTYTEKTEAENALKTHECFKENQ